jgi:hypothetical protein
MILQGGADALAATLDRLAPYPSGPSERAKPLGVSYNCCKY